MAKNNAPVIVRQPLRPVRPLVVNNAPPPRIYEEFRLLYEMVPFNSPAKRKRLLSFLKQYEQLNSVDKAEFDQFLKSGNGAKKR